jgi:hypothetical protein
MSGHCGYRGHGGPRRRTRVISHEPNRAAGPGWSSPKSPIIPTGACSRATSCALTTRLDYLHESGCRDERPNALEQHKSELAAHEGIDGEDRRSEQVDDEVCG